MRSALAPDNPHYPNILFYIPMLNRFADHEWIVVHDLYVLFDTWQINTWLQNGEDALLTTKSGIPMMLYYLNFEEEDEICDFLGFQESFGIKVDRTHY